jgi:hypothetical protein
MFLLTKVDTNKAIKKPSDVCIVALISIEQGKCFNTKKGAKKSDSTPRRSLLRNLLPPVENQTGVEATMLIESVAS